MLDNPNSFFLLRALLDLDKLHSIVLFATFALWQLDTQNAVMHLRLNLIAIDTLGKIEDLTE